MKSLLLFLAAFGVVFASRSLVPNRNADSVSTSAMTPAVLNARNTDKEAPENADVAAVFTSVISGELSPVSAIDRLRGQRRDPRTSRTLDKCFLSLVRTNPAQAMQMAKEYPCWEFRKRMWWILHAEAVRENDPALIKACVDHREFGRDIFLNSVRKEAKNDVKTALTRLENSALSDQNRRTIQHEIISYAKKDELRALRDQGALDKPEYRGLVRSLEFDDITEISKTDPERAIQLCSKSWGQAGKGAIQRIAEKWGVNDYAAMRRWASENLSESETLNVTYRTLAGSIEGNIKAVPSILQDLPDSFERVALLQKAVLHASERLPAPEMEAFLAGLDESDRNWAAIKLAEKKSR